MEKSSLLVCMDHFSRLLYCVSTYHVTYQRGISRNPLVFRCSQFPLKGCNNDTCCEDKKQGVCVIKHFRHQVTQENIEEHKFIYISLDTSFI